METPAERIAGKNEIRFPRLLPVFHNERLFAASRWEPEPVPTPAWSLALIDSLACRYPVGTLLLWPCLAAKAGSVVPLTAAAFATTPAPTDVIHVVLDGTRLLMGLGWALRHAIVHIPTRMWREAGDVMDDDSLALADLFDTDALFAWEQRHPRNANATMIRNLVEEAPVPIVTVCATPEVADRIALRHGHAKRTP